MDDLRFTLRQLARTPGFAIVAVVMLALGIGANTAIYSAVHRLLIAPLPYADVNRVVLLLGVIPSFSSFVDPRREAVEAVRRRARMLEQISVYSRSSFSMTTDAGPQLLDGAKIDANLLRTVGMRPVMGRGFTPDDTLARAPDVALLSHGMWISRFGGASEVIGRIVRIDDRPCTIVGVLPPDFTLPWTNGDQFWMPLRGVQASASLLARLRFGVNAEAAAREAKQIVADIGSGSGSAQSFGATFMPVADFVARVFQLSGLRSVLLMLLAAVGFVLLIACANVANLLLVRAWHRQRELAIRVALGATRARLLRLVLIESLILAILGGGVGALLGWRGLKLIVALRPSRFAELSGVHVEPVVLGWTLGVSIVAGLLFGVAPAMFTGSAHVSHALKSDARTITGGAAARRARSAFIVVEVALAVVLLAGAGLLVRSLMALNRVDPGVDLRGLTEVRLEFPRARFASAPLRGAAQARVLTAVRDLPGLGSAALAGLVPPGSAGWAGGEIRIQGQEPGAAERHPMFGINYVDTAVFRTVGLMPRRGRVFASAGSDTSAAFGSAGGEAVVSESFARQFWPNGNAVGGRFRPLAIEKWTTVVGVVNDVRVPGSNLAHGQIYRPLPYGFTLATLVLRSGDPLSTLVPRVTAAIAAADPAVRVRRVLAARERIDTAIASPRFVTVLLASFAVLAFALSTVGLYGVVSYGTGQRMREIGVRVALGARGRDVLRLIIGDGLRLAVMGIVIGLAGALLATRLLRTMLFDVQPGDPGTLAVVALGTILTAVAASYVPALRATRVDPSQALRAE